MELGDSGSESSARLDYETSSVFTYGTLQPDLEIVVEPSSKKLLELQETFEQCSHAFYPKSNICSESLNLNRTHLSWCSYYSVFVVVNSWELLTYLLSEKTTTFEWYK